MKKLRLAFIGKCLCVAILAVGLVACETGAQSGALGGAGLGALAGQAIGGNTSSTLIGAAVGSGIGYMIGNESDKKKASQMSTSSASYNHTEVGLLGGTRWQLTSIAPKDRVAPYASKLFSFGRNGHLTTTTTDTNGNVSETIENYRVVGSTLIINKPGYIINARHAIQGRQLIVDGEDFRAVLTRL